MRECARQETRENEEHCSIQENVGALLLPRVRYTLLASVKFYNMKVITARESQFLRTIRHSFAVDGHGQLVTRTSSSHDDIIGCRNSETHASST